MNAIELIAALKGADEETAMELVDRLQCGEIDCSVLPTGKDNAVQQAQIWAQEARTQKGIVEEIGKLVGCANDWEMVDAIKAALSASGGEAPVGWMWEAYGQRNFTAGCHHKEVLESDGVVMTPLYTHPVPPSVAVPEGWKLVPIEPTALMMDAACHAYGGDDDWLFHNGHDVILCHRAMVNAAPSPDHSGDANKVVDDLPGMWDQSDLSGGETDADHIADAGKVSFVDGLGAQRMTAEECKEGIEYIIHGDSIYWPLSDDDELRLIQAACGNGEFTYPQATPSVPENDNGVSSAYDSGYLDAMLYARVCCDRLDNPENTKDYRDCARFLDLIFKSEIDEAARLRTAGDEGEGVE